MDIINCDLISFVRLTNDNLLFLLLNKSSDSKFLLNKEIKLNRMGTVEYDSMQLILILISRFEQENKKVCSSDLLFQITFDTIFAIFSVYARLLCVNLLK